MRNALRTAPRAVISGCGVVSPLGCSVDSYWDGLMAGRSALRPIGGFDTAGLEVSNAAEVADFDPLVWLSRAEVDRLERVDQFALGAARQALHAAGIDTGTIDGSRAGVVVGTTLGAMQVGEEYLRARGKQRFDLHRLLDHPYYATATNLARRLGWSGPVLSPSIACASGTQAVALALELIRAGQADLFLAGGAEALCHFVVAGFNCLRATTSETVRPFDARRSGLLLGEGAALLVIESMQHAQARGATLQVEVLGSGLSGDATHMTAPARDGAGAARAMRMALADAQLDATAIDFVSAHGTGTVYNDAMEMAAIGSVFGTGERRVPVNSIKGSIGHTLAAAGAFEAVLCVETLRRGWIPPTVNCEQLDPACNLDIVRGAARQLPVRHALSTSSAFAGNNAAIVLGRAPAR